jgi:hypothetical protein
VVLFKEESGKDKEVFMKDSKNGAICCIGENKPEYFIKLRNLFLSIDRQNGEISKLDRIAFFMAKPKEEYKRELEKLGVKIINSTPVNPKFPHNNKVRMLERDLGYDWYILLDHDTIVCRNFTRFLDDGGFKASLVGFKGPPLEFWEKIYRKFNLEIPSIQYISRYDRKKILPYFNSGVLIVPGYYRKVLYDTWIYHIHELISINEQLDKFAFFIDQIALALALQKTKMKVTILPIEMNFSIVTPINNSYFHKKLNPYIIHYHNHINKKGYLNLKVSKHPGAKKGIKEFNKLLQVYKCDDPEPLAILKF